MLTESKKQAPSRQDMQDLAKSLHAMQDEARSFMRKMAKTEIRRSTDEYALYDDLASVFAICARAAGMLETILSHKEVDA